MTINQALAIRVRELLKEKKMSQYKLEQETGLYHSTMNAILNNRVKASIRQYQSRQPRSDEGRSACRSGESAVHGVHTEAPERN